MHFRREKISTDESKAPKDNGGLKNENGRGSLITPNLQVRVKVEKAIAILFQQSIKNKRKSFVYAVKGGTTSVRRWHLLQKV